MGFVIKTACWVFVLLFSVAVIEVTGRSFQHSSGVLVSDGMDHEVQDKESYYLVLEGTRESSTEKCEQLYGFLPCSYSLLGHLFLILVYEFLLFHGESYVASGGVRIFKILGPGVFGASAFQILGALPESLILLVSGLLNEKERAQEYALTGVGLLAGTTIFLLTVIWGICVITGNTWDDKKLESDSSTSSNHHSPRQIVSQLTGFGITTDNETSYTGRIMLLSLIPFLFILIPKVFVSSYSGERIIIIIALTVSIIFLLSYFFYQIFEPWIQKRKLEYLKHEHLVVDLLKYFQEHALGRLLTDDGAPNVPAIKSLFEEMDQDGDNCISFPELRELLHEIRFRNSHWDKDEKIAEVMKEFDLDADEKITMDEFVEVFTKWLDETKRAMDKKYHSVKSLKNLYQILQPWIQKRRKERKMKQQLVSEIIGQAQNSALGSLFTEHGIPDVSAIRRLFERVDLDKDNYISQEELKELITNINFGEIPWDADEAVTKIMEELDLNGDHVINEEEFIFGFSKWLNISNNKTPYSAKSEDDKYQKPWEETDMLVEEKSIEKSVQEWAKAVMLLVLGIIMLALLAEPLIESVHNFSTAANIPSFFISFMLVPLATNARGAISAIKAASRKKSRTTSLTFSEIYGSVFMNNILGFLVLLSLIYFCGLSWRFSAEVLIVLIVTAVMGLAASFSTAFPVWTSLMAFLLYPLSLLLVYLLDHS